MSSINREVSRRTALKSAVLGGSALAFGVPSLVACGNNGGTGATAAKQSRPTDVPGADRCEAGSGRRTGPRDPGRLLHDAEGSAGVRSTAPR